MKVSQSDFVNQYAAEQLNKKSNTNKTGKEREGENLAAGIQDGYQLNVTEINTAVTYSNFKLTMDAAAVDQLIQEGEDIRDSVQKLVQDLLERQGYTVEQLKSGEIDEVKVDEIARERARELIGPGGLFSPENVSDRIVNFSIAAFGGDKSKIDIIRDSIDQGFAEAEKILGELADVSKQTYELIQEKLDKWINENENEGESQEAS